MLDIDGYRASSELESVQSWLPLTYGHYVRSLLPRWVWLSRRSLRRRGPLDAAEVRKAAWLRLALTTTVLSLIIWLSVTSTVPVWLFVLIVVPVAINAVPCVMVQANAVPRGLS